MLVNWVHTGALQPEVLKAFSCAMCTVTVGLQQETPCLCAVCVLCLSHDPGCANQLNPFNSLCCLC